MRKGEEFVVRYRNKPVFRIVPVEGGFGAGAPQDDALYKAGPVGRSTDGLTSADHDRVLYGDADERGGAFHRHG